MFGAGDADIGEPALLFEPRQVVHRHLVWKQALFHADQKDQIEFQALGGVQCHQLHCVFIGGGLTLAGVECGLV